MWGLFGWVGEQNTSQVAGKPVLLTALVNGSDTVHVVYTWECASVNFQYLVNLLFPHAHQQTPNSFCRRGRKITHSAFLLITAVLLPGSQNHYRSCSICHSWYTFPHQSEPQLAQYYWALHMFQYTAELFQLHPRRGERRERKETHTPALLKHFGDTQGCFMAKEEHLKACFSGRLFCRCFGNTGTVGWVESTSCLRCGKMWITGIDVCA